MFAIEMDDMMVVLEECIFAVHQRVMDAEHTPHTFLFRGRDAIKLMLFHLDEMVDDIIGNGEQHLSVLPGVEVLKGSHLQHLAFLRHEKGGVHTDTVEAEHLLGIHAAHTRSHNDIRLFLPAQLLQKRQCYSWINRNIWCYDLKILQPLFQRQYSSAGCRRAKNTF